MNNNKIIQLKKIQVWNKYKKIWDNFKRFFSWKKQFYIYVIKKKGTWELFKRFFVWKKKINFLSRFSWLFNNLRILNRHYLKSYNFKNKKQFKSKYILCLKHSSFKSYNFLSQLELRLDLLLVKIHFVNDIKKSKNLIISKQIVINNKINKKPNYILKINDLLYINQNLNPFFNWIQLRKKIYCRKRRWYKDKTIRNFKFKLLYKSMIKNFLQVNYRLASFVYIRLLFNNEILKRFKFKELNFNLIKKFWNFN